MRTVRNIFLTSLLIPFLATPALAAEQATKDDAIAMVKAAVADFKTNGAAATYAEINNPKSKYDKDDLYLVAYDMTGQCLAHGMTPALVGKDLMGLKDVDGKTFVQERINLAKTQSGFWQEYKYMNPETHHIAPKQSYCEKVGETVICGGIYK